MNSWYDYADKKIAYLNRKYIRLFDGLKKIENFDELNVAVKVSNVFDKASSLAKRAYKDIALFIYLLARKYAGQSHELDDDDLEQVLSNLLTVDGEIKATASEKEEAKKRASGAWLNSFLQKPNPVTGYVFDNEVARRKQRLIEALAASPTPLKEIERAQRFWILQSSQYADDVTDAAMLEGYRDADIHKILNNGDFDDSGTSEKDQEPHGVTFVRWRTKKDEKVCLTCGKRDGMIYAIDDVPSKPHYHCRCWVEPVIERDLFHKIGDQFLDALGPISVSHPDEMERIISEAKHFGVEIRDNESGMSYSPGLKSGQPGQLLISQSDSLAAWLHEEQHMLDDANDGWLGFAGLFDIERRCSMEYNAYKREINLAIQINRFDIVEELIQACRQEIESFDGDWDENRLK